jgi:hypothetical protein
VAEPDDTIRIRPAAPRRAAPPWALAAGLCAAAGFAGWALWPAPPPRVPIEAHRPANRLAAPPPEPVRPTLALPERGFAETLAQRIAEPALSRLAENARILVLDFPDLESQAAMLNRVAALVEKAGLPRERVLSEAEMAAVIAATGQPAALFYIGHNYRARDLTRFFALAARDGVALNPQEAWLREAVALLGPEPFALISLPQQSAIFDAAARDTILRHEVAHGFFFTDDAFAAALTRLWREAFTPAERAGFEAFLAREGYDASLEELMVNEAMAYLLFTPDPRFFRPGMAGLDEAGAARLRGLFRAAVPAALAAFLPE